MVGRGSGFAVQPPKVPGQDTKDGLGEVSDSSCNPPEISP